MEQQVLKTIHKYEMLSQGATVVLAVSGGVDSMVMMDIFKKIKKTFDLTLIVAHLDHAKRETSRLDAQLVEEIAHASGILFEQDTLPLQKEKSNFHDYARKYRYEFFKRVAKIHGATLIATAHHANDQLETVLAKLMKTDVPEGLTGIWPKGMVQEMAVIRPLIDLEKSQLYDYATQHQVPYREDESNTADDYLRNRIRKEITPTILKERPDVLMHVGNLTDHLRMDKDYFDQQINELMKNVQENDQRYTFSHPWFKNVHQSLGRRLITRLIPGISKGALGEVLAFLENTDINGICDVGCGMKVVKSYDQIAIMAKENHDEKQGYRLELAINGENLLPDGRKILLFQGINEKIAKNEAQGTYLCYNSVRMPLTVRSRNAGDRIKLMHQLGHQTVKKIMIDKKVIQDARKTWPIIVDANEQLVWIPGLKKSPVCLKEPNSNKDLWLEIYE